MECGGMEKPVIHHVGKSTKHEHDQNYQGIAIAIDVEETIKPPNISSIKALRAHTPHAPCICITSCLGA